MSVKGSVYYYYCLCYYSFDYDYFDYDYPPLYIAQTYTSPGQSLTNATDNN